MFRTRLAAAVMLAAAAMAAPLAKAAIISPGDIDAVFKDFGPKTPGCALGVYSAGHVLYARGYGMADLDLNTPITPGTIFDIGSTSKQFTAAAILLLAQDGKLRLSDDVRVYIPELPDYGHVITIDHLLRHTSGLRDYDGLLSLAGHALEDVTDDDDALAIIVAQKALNFQPGTRWSYSNTGFFLASLIVKRVSGKTLAEFARARLFDPLGMRTTLFRDDHKAILRDRAVAYGPTATGGFEIEMSNWDQLGDGGVNTNVLDLARWDANFTDPKVGGAALVDQLGENGRLNDGAPTHYGRGEFVDDYRGLKRIHHGGAWAGYRAMLMRFPDAKVSIGLTCNVDNADTQRRAERVADVVLAAAFTRASPATAAPADPRPQSAPGAFDKSGSVGDYISNASQSDVQITLDHGVLAAALSGAALPLEEIGFGRFAVAGMPIELTFSGGGELLVTIRGAPEPPYRKVVAAQPSEIDMAAIAGRYHSPELGTDWVIRVDHGVAYVKARVLGDHPLRWVTRDIALAEGGYYAFTRDQRMRVTGFDFSASRMTRIRFDRRPLTASNVSKPALGPRA